ncbi:hypothetical protein MBLNU459_g1618t1 [Dothideomycetes sp. NU459]
MSRPLSAAESTAGSTSNTISTSQSKATSQKLRQQAPPSVSLFPLFLSNLRLLDLDKRVDWPDITIETFGTKHAVQNQKQRIFCVEWALFRLFELYNPEVTKDKLKPFFPPLEPLQSLNLRAALFRCLNELKKNGVLGREAVLRKTMLDECKGDRFEEVLILFSSMVVRQNVLAKQRTQHSPPAQRLGLASNLDADNIRLLAPLALAHRRSLTINLQRRTTQKAAFTVLSNNIVRKQFELQERHGVASETRQSLTNQPSADVTALIRREVLHNWAGNSEGCQTVLSGGKTDVSDAIMTTDFDELWDRFQRGSPIVPSDKDVGFLVELEIRVREQQDRLRRWREYRDNVSKGRKNSTTTNGTRRLADKSSLKLSSSTFNGHRDIRIGQDIEPSLQSRSDTGYADIVAAMNRSLQARKYRVAHVGPLDKNSTASALPEKNLGDEGPALPIEQYVTPHLESNLVPALFGGSQHFAKNLFSPLKNVPVTLSDSPEHQYKHNTRREDIAEPHGQRKLAVLHGAERLGEISSPDLNSADLDDRPVPSSPPEPLNNNYNDKPSKTGMEGRWGVSPPTHALSPDLPGVDLAICSDTTILDERLAQSKLDGHGERDKVHTIPGPFAATMNESVMPSLVTEVPRRPTLAERTRMSMAFSSSEDVHQPSSSPPKKLQFDTVQEEPQIDRRASLADRALQSMTMASSQIKRRKSKRGHSRSSLYPVNQFETPVKSTRKNTDFDDDEHSRDTTETTPRETLFAEEAEYESVFKSRPKVALSPLLSPALDDLSQLDSSPLGELGGGRRWGR